MSFEKSSRDPLIDSKPNVFYKFRNSCFVFFSSLFNSFEEKFDKAFQRVLIHMIDDAKRDA